MSWFDKGVKYVAITLALILACCIIGGILGIAALIDRHIDGESAIAEGKTYPITSDVTSLYMEISAADVIFEHADQFSVESNLKNLSVKEKNGTLKITEKFNFGIHETDAVLTVYIPADVVFERAEIITGAGRLTVDVLSARRLELELGAGEVSIQELTALQKAEIEGGAGKITISGGALHDLDFEMGAGQLNLVSVITGTSELDLGIGESNITLLGDEKDYGVDIDRGIGQITVNGNPVRDYGTSGNGKNNLKITGGIGKINLCFQEYGNL